MDEPIERDFGWREAMFIAIIVSIFALVGVAAYFLLPILQCFFLPWRPSGADSWWVVRPIFANRLFATGFFAFIALLIAQQYLLRRWPDLAMAKPTRKIPVRRYMALIVMCLLMVSSLPLYLRSATGIGPNGIVCQTPWSTDQISYGDVKFIHKIPYGYRVEAIHQNGPYYQIGFLGRNRSLELHSGCEGLDQSEMSEIATYISKQSEVPITRMPGTKSQ